MSRAGRLVALILAALAAGPVRAETACAPDRVDIRGPFGVAHFTVEIADDPAERAHGLMGRENLPSSQGMLFVYDRPGTRSFWMKNTLIPLDMLFVRADGTVQYVASMARPMDKTPISGGDGVLAVLEINGGLAKAIGIAPGAELRNPAFGAQAAWACAE